MRCFQGPMAADECPCKVAIHVPHCDSSLQQVQRGFGLHRAADKWPRQWRALGQQGMPACAQTHPLLQACQPFSERRACSVHERTLSSKRPAQTHPLLQAPRTTRAPATEAHSQCVLKRTLSSKPPARRARRTNTKGPHPTCACTLLKRTLSSKPPRGKSSTQGRTNL